MPMDKVILWCVCVAIISWSQAWHIMKDVLEMQRTRDYLDHKFGNLEMVDELLNRKISLYQDTLYPDEDEDEDDE